MSIHRNSSPEANQYTGAETLVYDRSGSKERMAENINRELEKEGFKNLGVKERPGLVVLRRTSAPALLVEAGFINSDEDNSRLDSRFDRIAQAIADGILETLREENLYQENASQEETKEKPLYRVQTGAFRNPRYAQDMVYQLEGRDIRLILPGRAISTECRQALLRTWIMPLKWSVCSGNGVFHPADKRGSRLTYPGFLLE